MSLRLAVLAALLVPLTLSAQPARGPKKKDDTPPGYTKDDLRGFTLYFSDRVLAEDRESKLPRKPLEALERELIIVESVVPADKVKRLKAVPIWVEWDERIAMGNGRGGGAVAVFYGGHQANVLGSTPFKSNAVTILSLRSLTAEHQPATDSGRCVTLHELAHAFHFHVVGNNNPQVAAAYKQAMERKLYDPALYVATNDHEYFAELSCCYLEKLDYFPRTRDDLKKLDPKGYELMEKVWGKVPARKDPAVVAKGPKLPSPDGDGQFPLTGTTDRVRPGEALVGTLPDRAEWKGRPVVAVQFPARSGRAVAVLPRLDALYAELKDFGLIAFAAETEGAPKEFMEKLARQRGLTIPLVGDSEFGIAGTYRLPHAYLYDHAGKCVFRGNPLDAEGHVRVAVGKAVLARLGKEPTDKAAPVAELLTHGAPMSQVFAKLNQQLRASPKDAELVDLQTALTAGGQKVLDEATERAKSDPVGAFFDAERLPTTYRGTPIEKPAASLLYKLRGTVKVERELRARAALNQVLKLDTQLAGKDLSFDPRHPEFKEENAQLLKQLADLVERVRKTFPSTRAADEAARLAERWDVKVN